METAKEEVMAIAPAGVRDLSEDIARRVETPVSWTHLRRKLAELAAYMRWGWEKSLAEDRADGWPRP